VCQEERRRISPVPYIVVDGTIAAWEPDPGDPCRPVVDRAQRLLARQEYKEQRTVLRDLFDRTHERVYVASYRLMEREDGTVWSWCVWALGTADWLLPEADYISIADTHASFFVTWADALRLGAAAITPALGYSPRLWRVTGAPTAAIRAALRTHAADPNLERPPR
jgi:hypothetical protein